MLNGCSGDLPFTVSTSSNAIFYISLHSALLKGFKTKVTELDLVTGRQTGQHTLSSDSEVTSKDSILYVGAHTIAPVIVWTDKSLKTLKVNVLGSKHIDSFAVPDHGDEELEQIVIHGPRLVYAQPHFLAHFQSAKSHWAEVYHVDASKKSTKQAYDLPQVAGKGAFSTSSVDVNVYFTRNSDLEVSLVSSTSHEILEHWPVRPKSHGGLADPEGIAHAVSEVVLKGGSSFAVRSAVTLPSGDWGLVRNGDPVWVRPESLAGVVAAAWAELPEEEGLAQVLALESHHNVLTAYIHRVIRHTGDLKHFPSWIRSLPGRVMASFVGDKPGLHIQNLQRDNFGFRKITIMATENGRVIALDAGDQGRIIWNIRAVDLPRGKSWDVIDIEVEGGNALIRVVGGEFLRVETLTGKVLQYQPGGLISSLKTSVPVRNASGGMVLVPINNDGSPGEVPDERLDRATTVVTRRPDGAVLGWTLTKNAKPIMTWEFEPAAGERISSVTTRPSHDPVASIGKALGDRNVLYKYLNPNLILITAVGLATSSASIYLLDSISGQTLYTTTHSGIDASKPIAATFSENWFAYSLFFDPSSTTNTPDGTRPPVPKSYQLIISEIYESSLRNDRGPLGSAQNFSSIHPMITTSSDISMISLPHVLSQAFVIPGPVSHMSVTSTLQGITPRSLLCILPSLNALLSIPRAVLDPRRPVDRDPTPAELEEGLFKYNPVLDFEPKWLLTHTREVMGLRGVITTPTALESTSLVFAYGDMDVFGTRVAPIGGFDILGKGFSKLQLVGTVLALGVGTGILAPMVSSRPDLSSRYFHCGAE